MTTIARAIDAKIAFSKLEDFYPNAYTFGFALPIKYHANDKTCSTLTKMLNSSAKEKYEYETA